MIVTDLRENKIVKDFGRFSHFNFVKKVWSQTLNDDLSACSNVNLNDLRPSIRYFKNCKLEKTANYLKQFIIDPTDLYLVQIKFANLGEMSLIIEFEVGHELKPAFYYRGSPVLFWYF